MRLLSIGRALPDRRVDNHSIFNAPAAFDYDAVAIDPEGVFDAVRELLDASADHATHADAHVVNGGAGDGIAASEVLRRRHDEVVRALEPRLARRRVRASAGDDHGRRRVPRHRPLLLPARAARPRLGRRS